MSLNWKEIGKILSELPLQGCRVQGIRQPDFHSLVLELFRQGGAFSVYINLAAGTSRIHRLNRKLSYPKITQRFAEFLRSRIRGGRITEVNQVPGDRLLHMKIRNADETTLLWFRLWGAASNIIAVTEDGTVLDAYYRRPGRGEETGGRYPPPAPDAGGRKAPEDFEVRPCPECQSFNDFIEAEYSRRENEEKRKKLLARLEKSFTVQEAKIRVAIAGLEKRKESYANPERHKKAGDFIMQNLHTLKKGDTWCKAREYPSEQDIEIPLDRSLSPYENAESRYRQYKKARNGLGIVEEELQNLRRTLDRLKEKRERLPGEENLQTLEAEIKDGELRVPEKEKTGFPGLRFTSGNFRLMVGRTAAENDELLRRHVRGNDLWLHTRDCPGAYVFVKSLPGKSVGLDTLLDAGNLAVFYSKARSSGSAELYYTQVKYLRRAKGEKTGTVLPSHEKNLSVKLDRKRLDRLQNS